MFRFNFTLNPIFISLLTLKSPRSLQLLDLQQRGTQLARIVGLEYPLQFCQDQGCVLLPASSNDRVHDEVLLFLGILHFVLQLVVQGFYFSLEAVDFVFEVLGGDISFNFVVLFLGLDPLVKQEDLVFPALDLASKFLDCRLQVVDFVHLCGEFILHLGVLFHLIPQQLLEFFVSAPFFGWAPQLAHPQHLAFLLRFQQPLFVLPG